MVAKIECGSRAVRIDEAAVIADLLGTSVDAMLGRPSDGADLMWAISKLSSNAHKMVNEVSSLQQRLIADSQDVVDYATRSNRLDEVAPTLEAFGKAHHQLENAKQAIVRLAGEFPLPGRG